MSEINQFKILLICKLNARIHKAGCLGAVTFRRRKTHRFSF
jgi:hypothetical protein